jgi:hypothetical protein
MRLALKAHCMADDQCRAAFRQFAFHARVHYRSSGFDDRKEAERNNEAARAWISGLEAVNRKLGLASRRPFCHAILSARLRLCRGHALPVDYERLLPDGRRRMRHREVHFDRRMEALLDEAEASGAYVGTSKEDFDAIEREALELIRKRKSQ